MASQSLTDRAVSSAKLPPHGEVRFLWDDDVRGFGMRLSYAGARTWIVQPRVLKNGVWIPRRISLGSYPDMGLKDARAAAKAAIGLAAQGIDPTAEPSRQREELIEQSKNTFDGAVEKYLAAKGPGWRPSTLRGHKSILEGLSSRWGNRPLAQITQADIEDVIDEIKAAGTPVRAIHTRHALAQFFADAKRRKRIAADPCEGVEVGTIKARERNLTVDELRDVWPAFDNTCETPEASTVYAAFFRTLTLTAQRRAEVSGMRWDELNLVATHPTWELPGDRTKNARPHTIYLAPQVAAIIESMRNRHADCPFVFSTNGKSPISGFSKAKACIDATVAKARADRGDKPLEHWRLHDLRRTASTLMGSEGIRGHARRQREAQALAAMGIAPGAKVTQAIRIAASHQAGSGEIQPHVVEVVTNHVGGFRAGVAGTYNRAAYAADARVAWHAWASFVDEIVGAAKSAEVVPFDPQTRAMQNQ